MPGRVILLGATGYTGRLTAEVMTRAGMAPVLAGRSADALVELVARLAPFAPIDAPPSWELADVADTASVRALVRDPEDVLVTTVGPFARLGRPAVEAAIDQGCAYLDSTGEPSFIREVFASDGPRAALTGARLLTAFGYDYVPGNLAGALAMADARARTAGPLSVEVGYFMRGGMGLSSGTKASAAGMVGEPEFAFRAGHLTEGRGSVVSFDVAGRSLDGLPVGGSEHFALPRLDPGLRDVGVFLGWAGSRTKAVHAAAGIVSGAARLPVAGSLVRSAAARTSPAETGTGPNAAERAGATSIAVARATDAVGRQVSAVHLEGPNPYDLTAELLAWGAVMLLTRQESGAGALGPVDAFGLEALTSGCDDMGLRRVT